MPDHTIQIHEIMTPDPICLHKDATVHDAHALMKQVKHLPIIDDDGRLVGVLSHKKIVSTVIHLLNSYGPGVLQRKEKFIHVHEVMESPITRKPHDPASEVIEYFLQNRLSCMPVVDDDMQVKGIVSASDFLTLCHELMLHITPKVEP
ncbi:CBS domain-containing protein [Shewanella submarina]|uniref:HPP family protein n=1 Tax=Shewanella submarina TaxID=2016376 RepID=A0ABV7GK94_9GAMM|nr:CBS domain-containing protein [Shewanella submarina]MCL1036111.1 CBS domain-containing protein [Shewanella submarina]